MQNNVYINISVTWRNSYSVAQQLLRTVASLNRNGNFVVFIYSWHGEVDQNIEHTIDAQQHFDLQHVHTFVLEFSQLKNWLNPIAKTRMYLAIWKGVIIKLCEMWKKRWKLENNKKVVALVNQLSMETTTWWGVGERKKTGKTRILLHLCKNVNDLPEVRVRNNFLLKKVPGRPDTDLGRSSKVIWLMQVHHLMLLWQKSVSQQMML